MSTAALALHSHARTAVWFAASFAIFFLGSKSLGFSLGYALDDYVTLTATNDALHRFFLSQGRFTFAIVHQVIGLAGLKQPELAGFGLILFALGLGWLSWLSLSAWLTDKSILAAAVGALIGAHPFFAEYVSFRQSLFPMGICFALVAGAIAVYQSDRAAPVGRALVASFLAALAAGINQIALAFFCIAILSVAFSQSTASSAVARAWAAVRSSALLGGTAAIIYALSAALFMQALGAGRDTRMSFLGVGDIPARTQQIANLIIDVLVGNSQIIGSVSAIVICVACVLLLPIRPPRLENLKFALAALSLFTVAILLSVAPIALSGVWWPVPRTLIAVPLAVAFVVCAVSSVSTPRQIVLASGFLLLASTLLAGKSSEILSNQQRLNRWDMLLARDVVSVASQERLLDATTPLIIHRARWAHQIDPTMPVGDMNVSAMNVGWAINALFEEASGRRLNVRLAVGLEEVCAEAPPFPGIGSVQVREDELHVCL